MKTEIGFAAAEDFSPVYEIFIEHGMDVYGDIDEHLILRENKEICAVAKLVQTGERSFHLENLAVASTRQQQGFGGKLLETITDEPWSCCQPSSRPIGGSYRVSTVARGSAVGFYTRYGYQIGDFASLDLTYQNQCDECPDREHCSPVPMFFLGSIEAVQ